MPPMAFRGWAHPTPSGVDPHEHGHLFQTHRVAMEQHSALKHVTRAVVLPLQVGSWQVDVPPQHPSLRYWCNQHLCTQMDIQLTPTHCSQPWHSWDSIYMG